MILILFAALGGKLCKAFLTRSNYSRLFDGAAPAGGRFPPGVFPPPALFVGAMQKPRPRPRFLQQERGEEKMKKMN